MQINLKIRFNNIIFFYYFILAVVGIGFLIVTRQKLDEDNREGVDYGKCSKLGNKLEWFEFLSICCFHRKTRGSKA